MGMIYVAFGLPLIGICLVLMAKEEQPSESVPKYNIKPAYNDHRSMNFYLKRELFWNQ